MRWKVALTLLVLLLLGCNGTFSSTEDLAREEALKAGDIDPGFGSAGRASTVFGSQTPDPSLAYLERSQVEILRISGDRRIISLGSNALDGWTLLSRHTQGGNLDTGFAQEGKLRVAANLKPVGLELYCLDPSEACESPSRIIVAGTQSTSNTEQIWLGAYSAKGLAEAGFGQGGVVRMALFERSQARQLALQPDGKILLLVSASRVGYEAQLILRFLPGGQLDESFANKGVLTVSDSNTDQTIRNMVLLPGGDLLLLGPSFAQPGWLYSVRYHPNGTPDLSYGHNAVASVFVGEMLQGLRETLQVDGSLIYWGKGGMLQLDNRGSLAQGFGEKGMVRFDASNPVQQVVALPSGYLYVMAAPANHHIPGEILLSRYYADGILDDGFGKGGTKALTLIGDTNLGVYFEPVVATLARYGNRVIVGGRTIDYSSSDRRAIFTLTRLR